MPSSCSRASRHSASASPVSKPRSRANASVTSVSSSMVRVAVMAESELTTDVPEHSDLTPKKYWDKRARGLGATRLRPASSCAEENLLGLKGDRYSGESIFIHEFAHTMHMGLRRIDPAFDARLKKLYKAALAGGFWQKTYAATNVGEYWAEGVQSYFDANREAVPGDGIHNHVDTREELKAYDPALFKLIDEVYRGATWRYMAPIFDGRTLHGWVTRGGRYDGKARWTVEDGAITGREGENHAGGLLYTARVYKNFEIELDAFITYPFDSGIFVRMRKDRKGAQVTLDYRPKGEIGGIYSEGWLHRNPTAKAAWKKDGWNRFRVRCAGEPMHLTVWMNGALITDYRVPEGSGDFAPDGLIGLQVHGSRNDPPGSKAMFRNLRLRRLPDDAGDVRKPK